MAKEIWKSTHVKYCSHIVLKRHNTVVSYLVAPCRASSRNSPIGLAIYIYIYIYYLYSSKLIKHVATAIRHYKVFPNACDFYKINPLGN